VTQDEILDLIDRNNKQYGRNNNNHFDEAQQNLIDELLS
jgi:hypothetical protein